MFKRKKIYGFMIFVLAISLVIGLSAMDSFSQNKRIRKAEMIVLKRLAKMNGYRTYQRGRNDFFLIVMGAVNPFTGKRLEGEHEVEFKCSETDIPILKKLMFYGGTTTSKKIECLIILTPQIIIFEEEEEN